jgi:DNA-binding MarR family transcriptional regulator
VQTDAFPGSRRYGEDERALLQAVRDLVQADREMRRATSRRMGLGETDMRAIRFVMAAVGRGQGATPHELARHLGISTAATTVLLDRLVTAGHVERVPHPTDGRGKLVVPTPRAYEETRTELRHAHNRMRDIAASVPPSARPALLDFLRALTDMMREETSIPPG